MEVKREDANECLMNIGHRFAEAWSDQKVANKLAELGQQCTQTFSRLRAANRAMTPTDLVHLCHQSVDIPNIKSAWQFLMQIGYAIEIDGTFALLPLYKKPTFKVVMSDSELRHLRRALGKCDLSRSEGRERWKDLNGREAVQSGGDEWGHGGIFIYQTGAWREARDAVAQWAEPETNEHERAKMVKRYWDARVRKAQREHGDLAHNLKVMARRITPSQENRDKLRSLVAEVKLARKRLAQATTHVEMTHPNYREITPEQRREAARIQEAIDQKHHEAVKELEELSRI